MTRRPLAVDPEQMTGPEVCATLRLHGFVAAFVIISQVESAVMVEVPVRHADGAWGVDVERLPVGGSLQGLLDWLGY